MGSDLRKLEKQLNVAFRNPELLRQAFTHSSYVNEHRMTVSRDNERLEFLGDAVLELTVSEFLYAKYPERSEGELTKQRASIVCEPSLVKYAVALRFGDFVLLGKGEEMTGGRSRPALLADVFEAFIGALYLDQGLAAVQGFLKVHMFPQISWEGKSQMADYKTQLQELVQQQGSTTLEYRIVDERGPAHEKEFLAEVWMDERLLGQGTGRSKKEAEQEAAAKALSQLDTGRDA